MSAVHVLDTSQIDSHVHSPFRGHVHLNIVNWVKTALNGSQNWVYFHHKVHHNGHRDKYTLFFYKNIFYKNIEAEICEILRIF